MEGATFVCAVGNHLRQQLIEHAGISDDRVVVTYMGVETSELAALGSQRSYKAGRLHLITVARLNPAKGLTHSLAAVRRGLQEGLDLHYTIAGEGDYRDTLVSRIEELGLCNHVTLPGTLSESEVYQLLSKADAFVLPSVGHGEAWPVSVMEAMGSGLPVIASVIGATPEMITTREDGFLVPQRDEHALLQAITHLANDIDLRRCVGEAARRTARRRFDVSVSAGTLRDAVRTSLNIGQLSNR
jgi:glycosyltransferase involved in cell wall biosynthesis